MGQSDLLGWIIVRETGLSLLKLQEALDIQRERGGRIGEILVGLGAISEEQLERALALQREQLGREREAAEQQTLLGTILVVEERLPMMVLQRALDRQKAVGGRLGEILISMHAIDEATLDRALDLQRQRRGPGLAGDSEAPVSDLCDQAPDESERD